MEGIGTVAAIGGLLLVLVLAYAVFQQRKISRRDNARTEVATRDLYAEIDREDEITDPEPKTS